MPWRAIRSFAKTFELSILAAAWLGPKTGIPAARSRSARPRASGSSGPTTTRSAPLPPRERDELVDGAVLHGHAIGVRGNARIPRRRHEGVEARTLRELPRERVLAAAAAHQQDLHSSSSTEASVSSRWERAICAHGLPRSSSR